jgi:hypothetical protein
MIKQNIVSEKYVQVLDELFKESELIGNKFKYHMYTSVGKSNRQECKVYPQVK